MAGSLLGIKKSIRRTPEYKIGGVALALAFDTFTDAGANQASIDATTGVLTVDPDAIIARLEFEENSCSYSDNTKIGNNRYPEHIVGFKLGGRSQDLNDFAKTADLKRSTWAIKTTSGDYLMLGLNNGMVSSQNNSGAGAGPDDFNGFDTILSGGETAKAAIITKADFDALIARVV